MLISKILEKKFFSYNLVIYLFLLWNTIKLFLINSDPIIQVLNLLISIGIYFIIEDQKFIIKKKKSFSFFLGLVLFSLTIIRSFLLNNTEDKYYYFNLPFGIFSLIVILKPFNEFLYLRNIFLISLLLPLRRLFFSASINFLMPLTKYLTWFVLFMLGVNPILNDKNLFIDGVQVNISEGCAGADNLFFVISTITIYMLIFRLNYKNNILFISISSILVSVVINILRNTIIALVVSSNKPYKDSLYYFLHDSYGSLIFSFISVTTVSFIYFKLLNKELKNQ